MILKYNRKFSNCLLVTYLLLLVQFVIIICPVSNEVVVIDKYLSIICFIWSIISMLWCKINIFHPYILFMFSFGIFIESRVILDVLCEDIFFNQKTLFGYSGFFSINVSKQLLEQITLSILFLNLGALYAFYLNKENNKLRIEDTNTIYNIRRIGLFFFYSFLIPYIMYLIDIFLYVTKNGYLSIYLLDEPIISNPILKISDDICLFGLFLYLSSYPKNKLYKFVIIFYFITVFMKLGIGARGSFVASILTFLSYYGFRNRIKKKAVFCFIGIAMCIISLSQIVLEVRNDGFNSLSYEKIQSILSNNFLISFVYQQGATIEVLGFIIEKKEEFANPYYYALGPLYNSFITYPILKKIDPLKCNDKQSVENANSSYRIAHKLSYLLDSNLYLSGQGVGSSIVSELYLFGGIFSISIFLFILMFILVYFTETKKYSYTGCLVLFYVLPYIYMTPRGEIFGFIGVVIPRLVFFLIMIQLYDRYLRFKIK